MKLWIKRRRAELARAAAEARATSLVTAQGPLMVVSPHPDDEVLGCGQLMSEHHRRGGTIHVVIVSSGELSHQSCCGNPGTVVAAYREKHAVQALSRIGVSEARIHFWRLPDGRLRDFEEAPEIVTRMGSLVRSINPVAVLIPHLHDNHVDHQACGRMALRGLRAYEGPVYQFAVWAQYALSYPPLMPRLAGRPFFIESSIALRDKRDMWQAYLQADLDGCGIPPVGRLPEGLLASAFANTELVWKYEH
jgi:LmbE family N-acetylglucosaminyl deacetylase